VAGEATPAGAANIGVSVIEDLLPGRVVSVEAFADVLDEAPYPGEEGLIANAVEKRRREFITARRCAREALAHLEHQPAAILAGPKREPVWPVGVVGSITHCDGYRAAACAPTEVLSSIGIDAEPHGPLPSGVLGAVTIPQERRELYGLSSADPSIHWDRLLFSAKESVYKAWYPLARCWLGFEDAAVTFDLVAGAFSANIMIEGPVAELRGRFLVERGLVLTAVAVGPRAYE